MFSKSIIIAACAAALFVSGCGKDKERADLVKVVAMRKSISRRVDCIEQMTSIANAGNKPGHLKREVTIAKVKNILSQPADVDQVKRLEELTKELDGVENEIIQIDGKNK